MWKSGWGHVLVYAAIIGTGLYLINRYQKKKVAEKAAAAAVAATE